MLRHSAQAVRAQNLLPHSTVVTGHRRAASGMIALAARDDERLIPGGRCLPTTSHHESHVPSRGSYGRWSRPTRMYRSQICWWPCVSGPLRTMCLTWWRRAADTRWSRPGRPRPTVGAFARALRRDERAAPVIHYSVARSASFGSFPRSCRAAGRAARAAAANGRDAVWRGFLPPEEPRLRSLPRVISTIFVTCGLKIT